LYDNLLIELRENMLADELNQRRVGAGMGFVRIILELQIVIESEIHEDIAVVEAPLGDERISVEDHIYFLLASRMETSERNIERMLKIKQSVSMVSRLIYIPPRPKGH